MMGGEREVLDRLRVSRETEEALRVYVDQLVIWQKVKNLVGPKTLDNVWNRHVEDSAQLLPLLGTAARLVDIGSGAGFPGLVLAILLRERQGALIHLVESNSRKCAFLRDVSRRLSLPVRVHNDRIEDVLPTLIGQVEGVTARALAPLSVLLDLTNELLKGPVVGVFPKGQDVERELTDASKYWTFQASVKASCTDSKARILLISDVRRAT